MISPFKSEINFQSSQLKGCVLACTAAIGAAFFYIPYKMALQHTSPEVFVLGLFLSSFLMNCVLAGFQGWKLGTKLGIDGKTAMVALVIAVMSILGNYSSGSSVHVMNPAITVVLIRTQVFWVFVMGWFFLKEKMRPIQWLGALVALGGVGIISGLWTKNHELQMDGIYWGLLAAFSFSICQVIVRPHVKNNMNPMAINLLRLLFASVILSLIPGRLESLFSLAPGVWILIAVSAFIGPLMARLLLMYALKFIPVSQSVLFSLLTPGFAAILAWFFMGERPTGMEYLGGFVIIFGVLISAFAGLRPDAGAVVEGREYTGL